MKTTTVGNIVILECEEYKSTYEYLVEVNKWKRMMIKEGHSVKPILRVAELLSIWEIIK